MTVAPAPPRPSAPTGASRAGASGAGAPDLLGLLRSRRTARPPVDPGLAGGLRAWLEDGAASPVLVGRNPLASGARRAGAERRDRVGTPGAPLVVLDGVRAARAAAGRGASVADLRASLVTTAFRLVVTGCALDQPFEDALCAISVTARGPETLDALGRLPARERSALRSFVQERAAAIAAQWRPVPPAWLPRTGEQIRVPLAGGAVMLSAAADLVLGRPSDKTSSVCLVRLHEKRSGDATEAARRTRRALALVETLRSGAPPWRVATYDPGARHLLVEDVDEELIAAAVHDVLRAMEDR